MDMIIPEQRNNNFNNCWKRVTKYGIENYSKDYYNENYERIDDDNIEKELLLFEIETWID